MKSLSQKVFSDNLKVTSGQVIVRAFSIPFLILYARILTPFELSVLPVFDVLAGMSILFTNLGLFPTLIREVPKLLEKDKNTAVSLLLTSSLIIVFGAGVFATLTFLLSGKIAYTFFKGAEFAYFIKLMSVGFFLRGLNDILTYNMIATSEFGKLTLKNIVFGIIQNILGVVLFIMWGLKGLIVGRVLGIGIAVIMSLYFMRSYLFRRLRLYPIKKLLRFSFPYYVEGYLMYFRSQGDQLIVGAFLSPVALSAYYIARRLFDNLEFFRSSVDTTIVPALAKVSASGQQRVEQSFTQISTILSYFAIPLCFLAASLSFAFVNLVGGEKYLNSTTPTAILCFTMLLYFFLTPISRSVFVLGKPVERLKITLVQSSSILLFLILLIRNFGISGVAFSRLLAMLTTLTYSYFTLRKLMIVRLDTKVIGNSFLASIAMTSVISFAQIMYYKLYLVPLYMVVGMSVFFVVFVRMLRNSDLELIESVLPTRLKTAAQIVCRLRPDLKPKLAQHN